MYYTSFTLKPRCLYDLRFGGGVGWIGDSSRIKKKERNRFRGIVD